MTKRGVLLVSLPLVSFLAGGRRCSQAAEDLPATAVAARNVPTTALGVDVGVGSAVGWAGVTLTRAVGRFFRLEVGGGYGVSGYQLSLMPKIALGAPHDHFVAGAGVSVAFPTNPAWASGHPVWLNVDLLGYEHRFDTGIALSAAVGLTGGLGGGEIWSGQLCLGQEEGCEPNALQPVSSLWLPQARIGAAYWF